jgi:translation initiation factor IF-1
VKTEQGLIAVIEAALPRGLYRVSLESGEKVTASIGGAAKQTTVRVIPGDRVMIERSPYDPSRGKITRRL